MKQAEKYRLSAAVIGALATVVAFPATAYVGPGAGLSVLGALWGLLAAVGAALLFILMWPIRRRIKRRKAAVQATEPEQRAQDDSVPPSPPSH